VNSLLNHRALKAGGIKQVRRFLRSLEALEIFLSEVDASIVFPQYQIWLWSLWEAVTKLFFKECIVNSRISIIGD
jgi:hypothetical protein